MNIRKLQHLLAVVENRSFRKAAEAVHLSQPALSRSLKSLEEELGIPLLDRAYGRLEPTPYRQPIVDHIRRIAAEDRALKESVRRIKGLEEGEIRVGFGPFAAATALCPVIRDVVARYPRLRVRIEIANSGLLLELLKKDRLDIVVGDSRYLLDPEGVTIVRLSQQTIAIVVNRDHELARRKGRLTLAELKGRSTGAPTLPDEMMQIFRAHGLDDFPTVTCDDMRVLVELAETTPMIALLPELVIDELKGNHRLAVLSVAAPFSRQTCPCVMYASNRTLGLAGSLLTELVRQWFGAAGADAPAETSGRRGESPGRQAKPSRRSAQ